MTLDALRAGDPRVLEALLQDVWTPLVRHLTGVTGSRDAAQDAAQEAFVRLWERRERWASGSLRALVYRIGRNVALDMVRRGRVRERWAREGGGSGPGEAERTAPPPDRVLEHAEVRWRVESALGRLAPRRREAFELVRFAGLTHQEVAEVMDLSPQTVANHLSLALRDLRAELADVVEPRPGREPDARSHDG